MTFLNFTVWEWLFLACFTWTAWKTGSTGAVESLAIKHLKSRNESLTKRIRELEEVVKRRNEKLHGMPDHKKMYDDLLRKYRNLRVQYHRLLQE